MNRRFLSIVLSTVLATSSLFTGATGVSAADESSGSAEKGSAVTSQSSKDDPVTLNVYGYRLSDKYYDGTGTRSMDQVMDDYHQVKVNRGDTIKLKIRMSSDAESIMPALRLRYDLHKEGLEWTTKENGAGDKMTGSLEEFMSWFKDPNSTLKFIPRQEGSLLSTVSDDVYEAVQWNEHWQPLLDAACENGHDPVMDLGACNLLSSDAKKHDGLTVTWDGYSIATPQSFSPELKEAFSKTTFTQESGDHLCTISFKVSEDASLGNEQSILIYHPEFAKLPEAKEVRIRDLKLEVTGSTYVEPTEPTAAPT